MISDVGWLRRASRSAGADRVAGSCPGRFLSSSTWRICGGRRLQRTAAARSKGDCTAGSIVMGRGRGSRSEALLIEALSSEVCIFCHAQRGDQEPFDICLLSRRQQAICERQR